jgi:hypothetical protein
LAPEENEFVFSFSPNVLTGELRLYSHNTHITVCRESSGGALRRRTMSAIAAGTWTADELMNGKVVSEETTGATISSSSVGSSNGGGGTATTSPTKLAPTKQFSMMKMASKTKKGGPIDPMDWGMPGHLTEEEVAIFVSQLLVVVPVCLFVCLFVCSSLFI